MEDLRGGPCPFTYCGKFFGHDGPHAAVDHATGVAPEVFAEKVAERVDSLRGDLKLERLLANAEEIIVFAVARLDVLTFPKWPFKALRELGEAYKATIGDDPEAQRRRELGMIWLDFAKEAESWEQSRAEGTHKIRLQAENLMKPAVSLLRHATTEQASDPKRNTRSKTSRPSKVGRKKASKSPKKPKK